MEFGESSSFSVETDAKPVLSSVLPPVGGIRPSVMSETISETDHVENRETGDEPEDKKPFLPMAAQSQNDISPSNSQRPSQESQSSGSQTQSVTMSQESSASGASSSSATTASASASQSQTNSQPTDSQTSIPNTSSDNVSDTSLNVSSDSIGSDTEKKTEKAGTKRSHEGDKVKEISKEAAEYRELLKKKMQKQEEERMKMQVLVSNFSEEQLNAYEMFRRAAFPKASIRRLMQSITGSTVAQNIVIAMSGISKVYVGEIVEIALDVKEQWGDTGPLQPKHLREAVRRMKQTGSVPNTKYQKKLFR